MESTLTTRTAPSVSSDVNPYWWSAAFASQLVICVLGAVGSALSIFSVKLSKKMHEGMALQFNLFFFTFLIICVVILPTSLVDEYYTLNGWQEKHTGFYVALQTVFGSFERNVFGLIAVYRLMAMCFPIWFKLLSRPAVVLAVDLLLFLGVVALWLFVFLTETDQTDVGNPSTSDRGFAMYCFTLFMPIVVTISAYSTMLVIRARKRRAASAGEGHASLDSVSFAVGITILANILLDVPHILIHFRETKSTDLCFVVVHVFYRAHFALDPLCFVACNGAYRKEIRARGLAWLREAAARVSAAAAAARGSSD